MKFIVVRGPYGILLIREGRGFRLPLAEDGLGSDDESRIQNLLAEHGLAGNKEIAPQNLGSPGLECVLIEANPIPSDHQPDGWLEVRDDDPALALHVFAKSHLLDPVAQRVYLRLAELLETRSALAA